MMAKTDRDRLIQTFMQRNRKKRPGRAQEYVSQGRAVENVANTKNAAATRADADRARSEAYYRHKLGYDKPGITPKKAKRAAKKAYHKINPWD